MKITRYEAFTKLADLKRQKATNYREMAQALDQEAALDLVYRDLMSVEEAQMEVEV